MLNQTKSNAPILIYALFIFGLLPFINLSSTCDPETLPRCIILAVISSIFLIYYLIKGKENDLSILKQPVLLCFLLYGILAAVSLYKAINFGDGLFDLLKIIFYIILLLLISLQLKNSENGPAIISKCVNIAVLIFSAYGLLQLISSYSEAKDLHLQFRIGQNMRSTLANKNVYSEVLLLSLPLVVYGAIVLKDVWRMICIFNTALIFISLIILMNVYVWLALSISMFFLAAIVFKARRSMLVGNQKIITTTMIVVLSVATIGIIAFIKFSNFSQVSSKIHRTLDYFSEPNSIDRFDPSKDDNNIHERILLIKHTWQMIKDDHYMGSGLGNWKIYCPRYGAVSYTYHVRMDYPHNDYLSILSEIGAAGLLCYLLFLLLLLRCSLIVMKRSAGLEDKWLGALLFCGLLSFAIVSFFGFTKEKIFPMVLLLSMSALILFKYSELEAEKKDLPLGIKRLVLILFIFSCGLLVFVGYKRLVAEVHLQRAMKAQQLQLWEDVILEAEKAKTYFYPVDFSATPIEWYEGLAFFYLKDEKMALLNFLKGEKYNPYHAHLLNDIGTCYENKDDQKKSIAYFERAYRSNSLLARKNLVAAYFNAGYLDKAFDLSCSDKFAKPVFLPQLLKAKTLRLATKQSDLILKEKLEKKAMDSGELIRIFDEAKSAGRPFDEALIGELKKN
jgi:O-antigen ligase